MSIFDTTANTSQNAFSDPFNPMNLNRGQWGMDPNYLTPNYAAPYRPPYMGGSSHIANQAPGFFSSLYNISPFSGGMPYGVGNQQQDSAYYDSLVNKPSDFGMSAMQRVGVPLGAIAAAYGINNAWRTGSSLPWQYGRKVQAGWASMWGASNLGAVAATRNVTMATAMGQRMGAGIMEGIVGGASRFAPSIAGSTAARVAIGGAGLIGGVTGSLALPLMAAQGAMTAADKMIFDPYIGVRENQNMLRQNFSGVTFGGRGDGDPWTGGGLGRGASGRIGTQLASFGMKDQIFNAREMASLTSMAAQTGLLDNTSSDQISKKMESLVRQLKVVMSVTGTTDFRDTMTLMAKMQMAGAAPGQIGSLTSQIGGLASAAGISTNRMMSTVGAQGQYLFQSNGLTPYLGQLSAATSMAGFASAFRTGLVSPEMMARMGGVEGASQLSVTAQVNGAQTIYNMMRNYNRYTSGRGETGDVIGNVSRFGQSFAADPLEAFGGMIAGKNRAISQRFAEEGGIMATHNQVMEVAGIFPGAIRGGKLSGNRAVAVMKSMGLGDDEINAFMTEYAARTNPAVNKQMLAGLQTSQLSTLRDVLEQSGQTRFAAMFSPVSSTYRDIRSSITRSMGSGVEGAGGLMDAFSSFWTSATVGSPDELMGRNINDVQGKKISLVKTWKLGTVDKDKHQNEILRLHDLARQGNTEAITILSSKDHKEVSNALTRLGDQGRIDKRYSDSSELNHDLVRVIMGSERELDEAVGDNIKNKYKKALAGSAGLFSGSRHVTDQERVEGFRIARDLAEDVADGKDTDMSDARVGRLGQLTGRDLSDTVTLRETVRNLYNYASENRIGREYGEITPGGKFGDNKNLTFQDRVHMDRAMEGFEKQRQMINKVFKEGRIDASSWFSANSGIELNKAATLFAQGVSEFRDGVKEMRGQQVTPDTKPRGLPAGLSAILVPR
jgi:hypothetical protein